MKNYFIYVKNEPIAVSEEIYNEYWKSVEHEKYQIKRDRNNPSLDDIPPEYEISYAECQLLQNTDPTKSAVDENLQKQMLHQALSKLEEEERKLISALYFLEKTEKELAEIYSVRQGTISKRKKKILNKLCDFLKSQ